MKITLRRKVVTGVTWENDFGGLKKRKFHAPFPYGDNSHLKSIVENQEATMELPEARYIEEDALPNEPKISKFKTTSTNIL